MSRIAPYPADMKLAHQGKAVPGSQTDSTSAAYISAVYPHERLFHDENGVPMPQTTFEIFEESAAKHPNLPLFRQRVLEKPTKPGQQAQWSTKTTDISYGEARARRDALGSALLSLERLGRLRDPNLPAETESPAEIIGGNRPAWGDRLKAGARRGWAVGIWSANRPEWQIVDLACQAYGLVSVSLYETLGPDVAKYITNHCPISLVFSSANHLVELLRIAPYCPSLRVVVSMDPLPQAERDVLTQWAAKVGILLLVQSELEEWGNDAGIFTPPGPLQGERQLDRDRILTISYTSGTTGNPKGVIISNWNMTSAAISNGLGTFAVPKDGLILFSYLPLSHIYQRFLEILAIYGDGVICYSTGDTTKLLEDAQIYKPNIFPGVPRIWNRLHAAVTLQMGTPGLKGALLRRAVAAKLQNWRETGEVTHRLWDALVFRKIKALVGGDVVFMTSGAAPLSGPVHELLKICFSCDFVQGYGLTESMGTGTKGVGWDVGATGTCGQIQPVNEIKLFDVPEMSYTHNDQPNPRGEICMRGDNIFHGYLHDPENTNKALDADGWFHTGDIGEIDSAGRLKVIDRVKNVVKLSQGEYVALEKLEGVYALDPLYTTLIVHGDSLRSSIIAVGFLDPVLASKMVKEVTGKRISSENLESLEAAVQEPKVREHLLSKFAKVAKENRLNGFEFIRGIHPTVHVIDDSLLTPTQKVKRNVAAQFFRKEIDGLYDAIEGNTISKI